MKLYKFIKVNLIIGCMLFSSIGVMAQPSPSLPGISTQPVYVPTTQFTLRHTAIGSNATSLGNTSYREGASERFGSMASELFNQGLGFMGGPATDPAMIPGFQSYAYQPDFIGAEYKLNLSLTKARSYNADGDIFLDGPFQTGAVRSALFDKNSSSPNSCLSTVIDSRPIAGSSQMTLEQIANEVYKNPDTLCNREYYVDSNNDGVIETGKVDDGMFCNCVYNKTKNGKGVYQPMSVDESQAICRQMNADKVTDTSINRLKNVQLISRLMNILSLDPNLKAMLKSTGADLCNSESIKNIKSRIFEEKYPAGHKKAGQKICPESIARKMQASSFRSVGNCLSTNSSDLAKCPLSFASMSPECLKDPASCNYDSYYIDTPSELKDKDGNPFTYPEFQPGLVAARVKNLQEGFMAIDTKDSNFDVFDIFANSVDMISAHDLCFEESCSTDKIVSPDEVYKNLSNNSIFAHSTSPEERDKFFYNKVNELVTKLYSKNTQHFLNLGLDISKFASVGEVDSKVLLNNIIVDAAKICKKQYAKVSMLCGEALAQDAKGGDLDPTNYVKSPFNMLKNPEDRDGIIADAMSTIGSNIDENKTKAMSDMLFCNTLLNKDSRSFALDYLNPNGWHDKYVASGEMGLWYSEGRRNKNGMSPLYNCSGNLNDDEFKLAEEYSVFSECLDKGNELETCKESASSSDLTMFIGDIGEEPTEEESESIRTRIAQQYGSGYGGNSYTGTVSRIGNNGVSDTPLQEAFGDITGNLDTDASVGRTGARTATQIPETTEKSAMSQAFDSFNTMNSSQEVAERAYPTIPPIITKPLIEEGITEANEVVDNIVANNNKNSAEDKLLEQIEIQKGLIEGLKSQMNELKNQISNSNGEEKEELEKKLETASKEDIKANAMLAALESRNEGIQNLNNNQFQNLQSVAQALSNSSNNLRAPANVNQQVSTSNSDTVQGRSTGGVTSSAPVGSTQISSGGTVVGSTGSGNVTGGAAGSGQSQSSSAPIQLVRSSSGDLPNSEIVAVLRTIKERIGSGEQIPDFVIVKDEVTGKEIKYTLEGDKLVAEAIDLNVETEELVEKREIASEDKLIESSKDRDKFRFKDLLNIFDKNK